MNVKYNDSSVQKKYKMRKKIGLMTLIWLIVNIAIAVVLFWIGAVIILIMKIPWDWNMYLGFFLLFSLIATAIIVFILGEILANL